MTSADELGGEGAGSRESSAPGVGTTPVTRSGADETSESPVSAWPARAAVALNRQFGSELTVEASPGEARSAEVPDAPASVVDEASLGDKAADAAADLVDSLLGDDQLSDDSIASGDIDDDAPSLQAPERAATTHRSPDAGMVRPPLPMPQMSDADDSAGAESADDQEQASATDTVAVDAAIEAPRREAAKRGGKSVMASPLLTMPRVRHPEAVVLFVHGGDVEGSLRVRRGDPAYLRMVPFARDVERRSGGRIGSALLRLSVRGWNEPEKPAVQDTRWAIAELRRRYPGTPIAIAGHSMGGRVVLDLASSEHPAAVVALAPWAADAYEPSMFRGVPVLAIHGRHDTVTDPQATKKLIDGIQADGGDARFVSMPGWHAMLLTPVRWHRTASNFLIEHLLSS